MNKTKNKIKKNKQKDKKKDNLPKVNNEKSNNNVISNNESETKIYSENELNGTKPIIKEVNDEEEKKESKIVNQNPTINYDPSKYGYHELDDKIVLNCVNILENAEKVNNNQIAKNKKAPVKLINVDSFWYKIFAPFKCDKVNNKNG